jgi:hypothetical protein
MAPQLVHDLLEELHAVEMPGGFSQRQLISADKILKMVRGKFLVSGFCDNIFWPL